MEKSEEFVLIKGSFSIEDAKNILLSLFNYKINFHELHNFSAVERFGSDDPYSVARIGELKESRNSIAKILEKAEKEGLEPKIDALIKIQLG